MVERLNREAVIDRAASLADELGLDEVTITKLGRALGIAPPGVYRHVVDAGDLRAAIGQRAASEVAGVLAAACTGLSGREALGALADALREWAVAHPGRYAALQVAPDPDDAAGQAGTADVLAVFGAALRAYALEGDDLTDAIRLVRSGLHGFIALERDGGFRQPRSVDATFTRLVDSFDVTLWSWKG